MISNLVRYVRPISQPQSVESARTVIRILFVSWAAFLLASQLICGCQTEATQSSPA
jgi:hypothetical protein